jgi:hypothetical protein
MDETSWQGSVGKLSVSVQEFFTAYHPIAILGPSLKTGDKGMEMAKIKPSAVTSMRPTFSAIPPSSKQHTRQPKW